MEVEGQSSSVEGQETAGGEQGGKGNDGGGAGGGDGLQVPREALLDERKKRQDAEKRLQALEAAEAERGRKAAEAAGEYERLYKDAETRRAELEARVNDLTARETARLEALATSNEKRIKALPAQYRGLVPEGLSPDAVSDHLAKLERLDSRAGVDGTRARGATDSPIPPEAAAEADRQWLGSEERRARYTQEEFRRWFTDNVWSKRKKPQQ